MTLKSSTKAAYQAATGWRPGDDIEIVARAFGCVVGSWALGEGSNLSTDQERKLIRIGKRALPYVTGLQISPEEFEEWEDEEDQAWANETAVRVITRIIKTGIDLMSGKAVPLRHPAPTLMHFPGTKFLQDMLDGKIDCLTAGDYGIHILECETCQYRIDVFMEFGADEDLDTEILAAEHDWTPEQEARVARILGVDEPGPIYIDIPPSPNFLDLLSFKKQKKNGRNGR